jgi:hypothetical protein
VKRQLAAHVKGEFRRAFWRVQPENGCCGALWVFNLDVDRFLFQTARPTCPDVYEALPEELKEIVGCGVDSPNALHVHTFNGACFLVSLHFSVGQYPRELPRKDTVGRSTAFVTEWIADRLAQKAAEAPPASAPVVAHGM